MRVVAATFAFLLAPDLAGSVRMVKTPAPPDEDTVTEDFDIALAEVALNSTNGEELQLTHEEQMQLVSDQTKFRTYINDYRKSLGLNQVCYNSALNKAAKNYAVLLKNTDTTVAHIGPDGSCEASRAVAAGYCYNRIGECGGDGRKDVWHMFNGWVNSPTHDAVMKGVHYKEMGMWCNPRSFDPRYRCILLMAAHNGGSRCCVENGCTKSQTSCCGSSSPYPRTVCQQCCSNTNKFPYCR